MEGPIEVTVTELRCTDCSFLREWGGYRCTSEGNGTATCAPGSVPLIRWICADLPVRTPDWCPVLGRDGGGK